MKRDFLYSRDKITSGETRACIWNDCENWSGPSTGFDPMFSVAGWLSSSGLIHTTINFKAELCWLVCGSTVVWGNKVCYR